MLGYTGETIKSIDKIQRQQDDGLSFKAGEQNVVLMLGIQGSGKTTVTGKLARWLTRHGYRVAVIGADTWRPGALTQLTRDHALDINPMFSRDGGQIAYQSDAAGQIAAQILEAMARKGVRFPDPPDQSEPSGAGPLRSGRANMQTANAG